MIHLEIRDANGNRTLHKLSVGQYRIGKADDCDIVLCDPHVSRHHASLTITEAALYVEDQGSTNGIWSNGHRLEGSSRVYSGDALQIGQLVLSLNDVGAGPSNNSKSKEAKQPNRLLSGVRHTETKKQAAVDESFQTAPAESAELVAFKKELHTKVLEYMDFHKRSVIHDMSAPELRTEAENAARTVLEIDKMSPPEGISRETIIKQVVAEAIGLGPIEPYLEDESITEIMVNGPERIFIERNGKLSKANVRYSSDVALMHAIDRIVAPIGRRIDEGSPMVDARLPGGSRVNVIIPPLSMNGAVMTIRKFSRNQLTISDLIDKGTLNWNMADFLEVCVKYRKNIVVSGGTGSGKTTTLNVLSNFIPAEDRIITIEDAAELKLHQAHVVSLEARPPNIESKGEIKIRDLVRNALRMRPDRIVVGECRGGEALDMLQAMNTGHDGSLTTGHANSPRDFLSRLEVMVLMSGVELPHRAIREQVTSAVDIIIHQERSSDGIRRITDIVEVDGMEGDTILLQSIFKYQRNGYTEDGQFKGVFNGFGYAPHFYNELDEAGIKLDRNIFADVSKKTDENRQQPPWEVHHG